ncbi:transglutaminase-like domain-containing protein [Paludifilum halophilum]|uniref:Transglutaminase-like domain-containing protein n=1 Tax=Paludifilum halophilum TaxID=1642702 RepID=A0A235B8C6_9BACL|nr:transglutaminase-like domain-containing protein [Paludifilum halophilum]OYD08511.1 hypothetical protein CHM34_06700 [Paludifilum halophilum]
MSTDSREVCYDYHFRNRRKGKTLVWMSKIPSYSAQTAKLLERSHTPKQVNSGLDHTLEYFELDPGEELHYRYRIDIHPVDQETARPARLSQAEKNDYLKSTTYVTITPEIEELARSLCKDLDGTREKAYTLFRYVVRRFRYSARVKKRGTILFIKSRKGDCGEFAALYAALCRSVGIPCRMVVGSFAVDKNQYHVWNEVFLEEGWIPVDTSMANVQLKQPWRFLFSNIRTFKPHRYFGQTEGQRIAFSLGSNIPCVPTYPDFHKIDKEQTNEFSMQLGEETIVWGKGILKNGEIPYLQPMYLYYEEELKKPKVTDYLGDWKVTEKGRRNTYLMVKKGAGYATLLSALLHFLFSYTIFSILYTVFGLVYAVMSVLRRERTVFFSLISLILLGIHLFVLVAYLSLKFLS